MTRLSQIILYLRNGCSDAEIRAYLDATVEEIDEARKVLGA